MMTIKQFEAATGLKRSTIRFYEDRGLLTPETKANGYRLYGPRHLETIQSIRLGQALGFSIQEIAALMAAWSGGRLGGTERRVAIVDKLEQCLAKRDQLDQLISYLQTTLAWIDAGEPGEKPKLGRT
ncbi:MAG: MerR family transcriptional regulator [Pseudomonadota bacterium]